MWQVVKNRMVMVAWLLFASTMALANVGDPSRWKPNFKKEVKAPAPTELDARVKAFAERNSKPNQEQLAKTFFALVDLGKVPEAVRHAVAKGDYETALNAYRDFFMDRLGKLDPDETKNFAVRPRKPPIPFEKAYLHTAEDLMNGVTVFGFFDFPTPPTVKCAQDCYDVMNAAKNQDKKGEIRFEFGQPGRANWTWSPDSMPLGYPHNPYDRSFFSAVSSRPHFLTALLVKYIETKDAKYWDKWLEYMDDICMNWRRDVMRAGFNPTKNLNNIEYFVDGLFANLSYMARETPELVKAMPASTLIRLLNRMQMEYMADALQYGRSLSTARRLMFDSWNNLRIALSFPEFKSSDYLVRNYVRDLEGLPMLSIMPDGCDVMDSRNYNKANPKYYKTTSDAITASPLAPSWVKEPWWNQWLYGVMQDQMHFIFGELWVNGAYPKWHPLQAEKDVFIDTNHYVRKSVPEAFTEPNHVKIISTIFGDGKAGAPNYTSDFFPFGGYHLVRSGWTQQDQWLYMASTRPVPSSIGGDNNSVLLYAYGRNLLLSGGSPVQVDDCNQIGNAEAQSCYPEAMLKDLYTPLYGKINGSVAYRTPLKCRWHNSESFDFCEGVYSGPFARRFEPVRFINDVSHRREILFARKLGVWVITDRMAGSTPHKYQWQWPFYCPDPKSVEGQNYPGFRREDISYDQKQQTYRASSTNSVNLTMSLFSEEPLKMDGLAGKLEGKGNRTLVSLLYPRKFENGVVAPDLSDVKPAKGLDGTIGFSASVPGGGRVEYQTSQASGQVTIDGITMKGEGLLLTTLPDGQKSGIALGCTEIAVNGAKPAIPHSDFEFSYNGKKISDCMPIYRPMNLPVIKPDADRFAGEAQISLTHDEAGVQIRYTLDGSDPKPDSPVYKRPFTIKETTVVKARAFRKGVTVIPPTSDGARVTAVARAMFTKDILWDAAKVGSIKPGLAYTYYEDDGSWPISVFNLEVLKPVKNGTCPDLFDTGLANTNIGYAFIYAGYLDVAKEGLYTIHAPPEFVNPTIHAGYDLRLFVDGREWYPATQPQNYGNWSIPLKTGKHAFRVLYINQQTTTLWGDVVYGLEDRYYRGNKPGLKISGPGLEMQAIPAGMLYH
jgi:hypothetical protein